MSFVENIKWGTVYKAKSTQAVWAHTTRGADLRLNDQRYNLWVPIHVPAVHNDRIDRNEAWYMIDTYQIRSIYDTNSVYNKIVDTFSNEFKQDGSSALYETGSYYYRSAVELSDYTFDLFEEWIDLHDYHPIRERDSMDYDRDDIVENVRLFHEHAYPTGIILCKNSAKKDYWNSIEAACKEVLDSCKFPKVAGQYSIEKLKSLIMDAGDAKYNKTRVTAIFRLLKDLVDLEEEFNNRYEKYSDDIHNYHDITEEDWMKDIDQTTVKLGTIHPDIERYLREDCYCPGEVYSFDGFGYQIFGVDDDVIKLGEHHYAQFNIANGFTKENVDFYAVVKKSAHGSQILLIMIDTTNPDKIFDLFRMDATKTNYNIIMDICKTGTFNGKFDSFKH